MAERLSDSKDKREAMRPRTNELGELVLRPQGLRSWNDPV